MGLCGLLMITVGRYPAEWISPGDPRIIHLTIQCLRITGFIQIGFAACVVFGGALRGAGDTLSAMTISLTTIIGLRFTGVIIIGWWLHLGLAAVWCVSRRRIVFERCADVSAIRVWGVENDEGVIAQRKRAERLRRRLSICTIQ